MIERDERSLLHRWILNAGSGDLSNDSLAARRLPEIGGAGAEARQYSGAHGFRDLGLPG